MNFYKNIWIISITLLFAACFPKEEGIEPKPRINKSAFISTGENKTDVTFYSLAQGKPLATVKATAWDIYVDADKVKLNYMRSMKAAKVNAAWHEKLDTTGLDFKFLTVDASDKQWELDTNQIYVLDLGLGEDGKALGLVKVLFERTSSSFTITHSPVESAYPLMERLQIQTDAFYFNLRSVSTVDLPLESEYDIAFGIYTDLVELYGEILDYPVFGAITSKSVAAEIDKPFEEVSVDDLSLIIPNPEEKTVIGWDWKSFNIDINAYELTADKTYIVWSETGLVYKLRFVDFYNNEGISGHPTFEYKLL